MTALHFEHDGPRQRRNGAECVGQRMNSLVPRQRSGKITVRWIASNLLVLIFFGLGTVYQTIGSEQDLSLLRGAQIVGFVIFVFELLRVLLQGKSIAGIRKYRVAAFILFACVVVGFSVRLVRGIVYFFDFVYPLGAIGVALMMMERIISVRILSMCFYGFVLYLLSQIIQGIPPAFWVKGSHNHVSVMLISLSSMLTFYHYYLSGRIVLAPAIVSSILALLAIGRAGILSTSLMVLALVSARIVKRKTLVSTIGLGAIVISVLTLYADDIAYSIAPKLSRFQEMGLESNERMLVVEYYLDRMDIRGVILGSDIQELEQSSMALTSHNSYLDWHIKFGFGSFLLLGFSLYTFFRFFKKDVLFASLLGVIMLRSFTDQILLMGHILIGVPFICLLMVETHSRQQPPSRT